EVGDLGAVGEQENRQVGASKLDPARAQLAPNAKAKAIAIKRDTVLRLGHFDIGVNSEHCSGPRADHAIVRDVAAIRSRDLNSVQSGLAVSALRSSHCKPMSLR